MDGHIGNNQIFIVEANVHMTDFQCPGALRTYEWVVIHFGLKNVSATDQRAMNTIFHDLIGTLVEVYIDDVMVKPKCRKTHLDDLQRTFLFMRQHKIKMNLATYAFGISAGNFLGFLVHYRGIKMDKNKARAIIDAQPPVTKKQLQSFLYKINFLCQFISNSEGKMKTFSTLLKLKDSNRFQLREEHQEPLPNLYISAEESIGCLLAQDNDTGQEHAIIYLS